MPTPTVDPPSRFVLLGKLGEGAGGEVYRACDLARGGRQVAVKLARRGGEDRLRFEADVMSLASHPHLVPLLECGDGWLTMPVAGGRSLREAVPAAGMPPRRAVGLAAQVLRALHHLHARCRVVHRDVKPANVLLGEDGRTAYLADFGAIDAPAGLVVGTPAYLSPEQTRGEQATPCSDVYGAAVLLFELLTGSVPFDTPYPRVLADIRRRPPPAPSSRRPGIDARLDELALRGLAKDPAARYPSAAAFADALEEWQA